MPTGKYPRTKKHIENIIKNHKSWSRGKKGVYSKETLKKMSLSHKGKKFSEEHKKNLSNAMKGRVPWNKGIIGYATSLKGRKNWNKGKDNGMYGKKHSKKAKKMMSHTRKRLINLGEVKVYGKGIPLPNFKGENHPLYGKHHTEKSKRKMSKSHLGLNKLNSNGGWLGGKSFEPYGIKFNKKLREQIRKRNNHTCQECGKHQGELRRKLSTHHIDYNKQNNNSFNLISLCLECHTKTNFNRKHWQEHFQMKMFIKEMFNPENLLIFDESKQLIEVTPSN